MVETGLLALTSLYSASYAASPKHLPLWAANRTGGSLHYTPPPPPYPTPPPVSPSKAPPLQTTFHGVAVPKRPSPVSVATRVFTSLPRRTQWGIIYTTSKIHKKLTIGEDKESRAYPREAQHKKMNIFRRSLNRQRDMEALDLPSFLLHYRLTSWLLELSSI